MPTVYQTVLGPITNPSRFAIIESNIFKMDGTSVESYVKKILNASIRKHLSNLNLTGEDTNTVRLVSPTQQFAAIKGGYNEVPCPTSAQSSNQSSGFTPNTKKIEQPVLTPESVAFSPKLSRFISFKRGNVGANIDMDHEKIQYYLHTMDIGESVLEKNPTINSVKRSLDKNVYGDDMHVGTQYLQSRAYTSVNYDTAIANSKITRAGGSL